MVIPKLQPKARNREYNSYSEKQRDEIIYGWLFWENVTHRDLDEKVLGLTREFSKGYQAMNILHHIGLVKDHKAIFRGITIEEAKELMIKQDEIHFSRVIEALRRFNNWDLLEEVKQDVESENAENNSQNSESRPEGKVKYMYGKKYERDPRNRAASITFHGTKCKICDFDFEKVYGRRGKGYIEIHHVNPLSNIGEEVIIDPKKDLIPVCANCHRMIHRRKDSILSVEEMKELLNKI